MKKDKQAKLLDFTAVNIGTAVTEVTLNKEEKKLPKNTFKNQTIPKSLTGFPSSNDTKNQFATKCNRRLNEKLIRKIVREELRGTSVNAKRYSKKSNERVVYVHIETWPIVEKFRYTPNETASDAVDRMARAALRYLEQGRSLDALENPQNFNNNRDELRNERTPKTPSES